MSDTMRPVVLSLTKFVGIEAIDGGDTIVVRFQAPDGREVVLLIPQRAMTDLQASLTGTLPQSGSASD